MASLYDEADVYLNAPNIDNMPNSVLEAFAAGLPVVTTDAGGIPYVVKHRETGLMVSQNDDVALANEALRLFREPGLAERIGANARSEALQRYSWTAVHSAWRSVYGLCEATAS